MPIIPTYDAHVDLDPDRRGVPQEKVSQASAQAAEQMGRAVQGLGSQVSSSGGKIGRAIAQAMPSFDAPASPDPASRDVTAATPHAAEAAPAAPTRAHDGAPTADQLPFTLAIPAPAASVAERSQQLQQQTSDFATGLQDDQRRQAIQGAFDQVAKQAPSAGTDLYGSFMSTADEMAADTFKTMPDTPAKITALEQWKTERQQWGDKAAALQWQRTGEFSRDQLATIASGSVQEVKASPDAMDGILATGQQRILSAPGLQPDERAATLQQFSRSVLMTGLAAKFPTDPDGLRRALSLDAQNAPLDRTGYNQWLRDLPKEQFDGLMASAQAARDKDPSVSVDHRLQDAYRASAAQQQASQQAQAPNSPDGATIPTGIAATPAAGAGSDYAAQSRNPAFSNAVASGRAGQAMTYFMRQGWSQAQAAGIVGNLLHESGGLNTAASNAGDGADGSTSVGLAQWNGKRAQALDAFAAARGTSPTDFGTQLAFVQHELTGSEKKAGTALQQASNVHDAAAAVALKYERPAGSETGEAENTNGWNSRLRNATALAAGQFPAAGPVGSPNARYAALSQQDVQQLVAGAEAGKQRALAQAEQMRQTDQHTMAQAVNDDVASAQATGQGAPNMETGRVAAVLGPGAAQQWADRRAVALDVFKATAGMGVMSNEQLAETAERFHPGDDEEVPGYARKAAVYFGVHDTARQVLAQRAADPAAAVDQDVGVMAATADASQRDASQRPAAYEGLARARLAAQAAMGFPIDAQSPVTVAEAKVYAAHMDPPPGGDPMAAMDRVVQDISTRFGRYAAPVLAEVMMQRTGRRDVGDVLSAALMRARATSTGPIVTTAEGSRLAVGRQASTVASLTGAPADPAPAFDNPMGDAMGGSAAPPPAPKQPYSAAISQLYTDPDRLLPFFIQKFGLDHVPSDLRGRASGSGRR